MSKVAHERGKNQTVQKGPTAAEGVGYAHSSVDIRKGKTGSSEGALLGNKFFMN